MAFRGPRWPIERHLGPKPDFRGSDLLADLFCAADRSQSELRDTFDKAARAIDANPDLTESGKQKARRELVRAFRESDDVKRHQANVAKGHQKIRDLRTELTTRPAPENESAYEGTARAHREHRVIMRYEALPPDQRRAAVRLAIEARDVNFLEPVLREPGLLSGTDAARVQAVLLEGADRNKFNQLIELAGRFDDTGQHDPQTSAVADFSVGKLLEHVDQWAGLDRATEDARVELEQQLKVDGAPLRLNLEQARHPGTYRLARDLAGTNGRQLEVVGDTGEVDSSMAPPPSNGDGGNGQAT